MSNAASTTVPASDPGEAFGDMMLQIYGTALLRHKIATADRQHGYFVWPVRIQAVSERPRVGLTLSAAVLDNIPMVFNISGVHQVGAVASGVDKAGHPVNVDVTAYVLDAGDVVVAVSVVEKQVLNEPVIPDGKGGFTKPTLVTGNSVAQSSVLPVAPLIYRHAAGDAKFPVNAIYDVQVLASMTFESVSATFDVYPLNLGLLASIALAKADVLNMKVLQDPEGGQCDLPDTVIVYSAVPVSGAPFAPPKLTCPPSTILIGSVVIPAWGDQVEIARGGGGLPSADSLGLNIAFVIAPNDGSHGPGDVISLSPPAGTTVLIGSVVTATIWGQSSD